jgi:hypothetical protein
VLLCISTSKLILVWPFHRIAYHQFLKPHHVAGQYRPKIIIDVFRAEAKMAMHLLCKVAGVIAFEIDCNGTKLKEKCDLRPTKYKGL